MAVEKKRGCGYRRIGGLYVVGGGLSAPCDRMPYALERCRTCGGGIKFTRGPQWLQPDFFSRCYGHGSHDPTVQSWCQDESACPVCHNREDFGPHILLWIGRKHYTPEAYLEEGRRMGVSRRLSALLNGLVLGETWVLLAHLDAVPVRLKPDACAECGYLVDEHASVTGAGRPDACLRFEAKKSKPGIFCAFVPRAVELVLKQSDATPERIEKEAKRGVTVVAVPDDDPDHQGSVHDRDEDDSQPELPGAAT